MAIYLVKDSPTKTITDTIEWSDKELSKARRVLEREGFELNKGVYARGKDTVSIGKKKIMIDKPTAQADTVLYLIQELMPEYCINDIGSFYLPSDWQEAALQKKA